MNEYVLNGKRILIYGAASYGKRIYQRFIENGFEVAGFIDKRADEIREFVGVKVISPEESLHVYEDMVLFVAVKNVFEHSNIVKYMVTKGLHNIIYRPYAVLTGGGNDAQKRINMVYTQIDEDSFREILPIPVVYEENIFEKRDYSVVWETDEEVVAKIPWQSVFTNKKKENSSIWSSISVAQLIPHIAFFSYLLGNREEGAEEYLEFCEKAAGRQEGIAITERWKENVIRNRKNVFQQMNLAYELEPDFFIDNASTAEWNTEAHCFNLKSGKHRAAFLIAKGNKYIPLRISREDYLLYNNNKDDIAGEGERIYHHRILHPQYLKLPFAEWDFYSCMELRLLQFMTREYMYPAGKISLQGERMLFATRGDNGSIARTFSYLGMYVERLSCDEIDLVKKIDRLMQTPTALTDIDDIGKRTFDFGLIEYTLYAQMDPEEMAGKCKKGMFLLGPKEELRDYRGTLIFEGINGAAVWQLILKE